MNKLYIRGLLTLFVCANLWVTPEARASQCAVDPPSKYIPAFRLVKSVDQKDFEVREFGNGIEVSNTSSNPIYVLPSQVNSSYIDKRINKQDKLLITTANAGIYLSNTPYINSSRCGDDGGVSDGKPIPQNASSVLMISSRNEIVNFPIEIVYIENLNYEVQLREYQDYKQRHSIFYGSFKLLFLCGCAIIFSFIVLGIQLLLRNTRERKAKTDRYGQYD